MISYLITDPRYYSSDPAIFRERLLRAVDKYTPDKVCFRDKVSENYAELAEVFIRTLKDYRGQKFINSYISLAFEFGFDGVHLPSDRLDDTVLLQGLEAIYSAHSLEEIELAKKAGVDTVTLSPVFATPDKGVPMGIKKLEEAILKTDSKIIALGGIDSDEKRVLVEQSGAYGFASIRYFVD